MRAPAPRASAAAPKATVILCLCPIRPSIADSLRIGAAGFARRPSVLRTLRAYRSATGVVSVRGRDRRSQMSIATQEQAVVERVEKRLYIGGEWRDAAEGGTLAVEDPSTGEALCEVADATPEDAKAALDAAVASQAEWAATPPNERGEILWRAFEALNERADELALLMTLEMGKAVAESKAEIAYAAEFFRWFSGEALRIDGNYKVAGNAASRVLVMRQPVGPCFFVTPWNFPTAMGTRKVGPAIAAGCTMVWKPAKLTPLSALALAQILEECGLPGGRAQLDHQLVLELRRRAGDRRSPSAQAELHRLDRGGAQADRPSGRERPQRLDGAGRERPLPDLRRRRPRRGAGGCDAGEDAQHRRGVHIGQPLPRRRIPGRGVRVQARGAHGLAEGRPGDRGRTSTSGR